MARNITINEVTIEWLGNAGFKFKLGGLVVYTDPYNVSDEKADLVMITHDHYDHCDPTSLEKIVGSDTVVLAPQAAVTRIGNHGIVKVMSAGKTFNEFGVTGKAVPAYNLNKQFHPKGVGLGYVFTIGSQTIYHAGDTDAIPEMRLLGKVDIALLPIGGTYTMDPVEAADAANSMIRSDRVIPMHWGSIVGSKVDAERFKRFVKIGRVEILE